MTLSRSSGAVLVRDTAPAMPPAMRWLHDTPNMLPFCFGKSGGHVNCSPMSIIYLSPTTHAQKHLVLLLWSYSKLKQIPVLLISTDNNFQDPEKIFFKKDVVSSALDLQVKALASVQIRTLFFIPIHSVQI